MSSVRPDNGQNAVLGNITPSSAPPAGALGQMNPSVSNNVKETLVNAYATYPLLVRRWREGFEEGFVKGDLIFVYTHDDVIGPAGKTVTAANLHLLNYILRGGLPEEVTNRVQYMNLDHWSFVGVLRCDAEVSNSAAGGIRNRNSGWVTGNKDRILNVDVRGATAPLHYWGSYMGYEGARAGDTLYLKSVKVQLDNFAKTPVTQLVPTCSSDTQTMPTLCDLVHDTLGKDGHKKRVIAQTELPLDSLRMIPIGRVFQHVGAGETPRRLNAFSLGHAAPNKLRQKIHVFLRT